MELKGISKPIINVRIQIVERWAHHEKQNGATACKPAGLAFQMFTKKSAVLAEFILSNVFI